MKFNKLLLLSLPVFALTSCGGPKSYKNKVERTFFIEKLENLTETLSYMDPEKITSFVLEGESKGKDVDTYLKDRKEVSEKVIEEKGSYTYKYDAGLGNSRTVSYDDYYLKSSTETTKTSYEIDELIQPGNDCIYTFNDLGKTYEKENQPEAFKFTKKLAYEKISSTIEGFIMAISMYDDDADYYVDDNVYTIVHEKTEESPESTKHVHSFHQLTIASDGFDYYEEELIEYQSLTLKIVDKDEKRASMTVKDVSLKTVSINDYVIIDD